MRTSNIQWRSHLEKPAPGSVVVFDYGSGPVVGTYYDGSFLASRKHSVDRLLVNRWRYCSARDRLVA